MRSTLYIVALLALASFGARAGAQDVVTTYGFSKLQFRDPSMTSRGLVDIPSTSAVQALAYAGNATFYELEGYSNDGQRDLLVRIDAHSGTRTIVGSTLHDWNSRGLDIDPTTGLMYVLADVPITYGSPTLYSIDPATAAVTAIAQCPGNVRAQSFAIDAQGRAYVANYYSSSLQLPPYPRVYRLDLATAQTTLVADFAPFTLDHGFQLRDAAFRANGELWLLSEGAIYALDLSTLTGTIVTTTWSIDTLAFAPADEVGLGYPQGCSGYPPLCPCNDASYAGNGCPNSATYSGGNLRAFGVASLSNDTLQLATYNLPVGNALFFQGTTLHNSTPFGDGWLCVGNPRRLVLGAVINGGFAYPSFGQPSLSALGQITAPGTFHYQTQYRDNSTFCTAAKFNTTNSVTVTWTP